MKTIQHKFVEFIPDLLEEDILYISIEYRTAIHKCICGCGNEVVTPLSPHDWELAFNGQSVSLSPSIGNWSFACRSHYWITKSWIKLARKWSTLEIEHNREYYNLNKKQLAKSNKKVNSKSKPGY